MTGNMSRDCQAELRGQQRSETMTQSWDSSETREERLEMKGERVIEVVAHADRTDDARK